MNRKQLSLFTFVLLLFTGFILGGCKKGDDNNGGGSNLEKNMKFTFTTTGLQATDDFDITIAGGDIQGTATTMFKVNGAVQNNQRTITISRQQLMAGQVIVETTTPLYTLAMSAGGFSGTTGHTFTFKMEPVIDGSAKTVITETIGTSVFAKQYSY